MTTYSQLRGQAVSWPGVMDRSLLSGAQVQAGGYLADMAKRGRWHKVLRQLDRGDNLVNIKGWRPGGKTWLTVLHQAAWNAAPLETTAGLIARGALRSQADARGRTAHDIAVEQGAPADLVALLTPPPAPLDTALVEALNTHLAAIIDDLIQQLFGDENLRKLFRYPPVGVLHETPADGLWFAVPYLWGGFRVALAGDHVELTSGYRELTPAGDVHVATAGYVITADGATQVSEGYQ